MERVTLLAHYDGTQILLDEPFQLAPNTRLMVTILPASNDAERAEWERLAMQNFEHLSGPNEPDYPLSAIQEMNPDYEGG